ncbi:MAG: class I SAM-dependent methyltransferase [Betaproteobacteria bacterium]|nr:class I SAM-dependent methyltransferase [Betaproteobacteria bacterium]
MSDELTFTGERFIPGVPGEIWYEHWHRYHFAAPVVADRDVLDIACGAGYGSALLARHAARVVGADLSQTAIEHARARYASVPNLEFRQADCAALPFPDASFDVVVSFETLEHIAAQEAFFDEVRRVLRPSGLVVLSCPNKVEYTDKRGVANEFHVRELYRDELAALIGSRFPHSAWYGQRPSFYSVVWPERGPARGEILEVGEASADTPSPGHSRPLYFIVVAGSAAETVAGVVPVVSVLADRDEWIYRDYEKVTKSVDAAHRRSHLLAEQVAELQRHRNEAVRQDDGPQAAEHARLGEQVAAQQREIARRASLRWWLALPLRRLWLALTGRPPWA